MSNANLLHGDMDEFEMMSSFSHSVKRTMFIICMILVAVYQIDIIGSY